MQKLNIALWVIVSIFMLFLSIALQSISYFIILLFFLGLYLLFYLFKKYQSKKEEEERIEIDSEISRLTRLKEEKEEELEKMIEDEIVNNIVIGSKNYYNEAETSSLGISVLDDKIRFYTEEDYNTTDFSKIFYDVENISGVLVGKMREYIKKELNSLNRFIREAQDMPIPVKPFYNIDINKVIFDIPNEEQESGSYYTNLSKEKLTKTGKPPKYPYNLFFRTVEKTWVEKDGIIEDRKWNTIDGVLYYLPNQTIGKGWFIMWKNNFSYKIELKLINDILAISKIEYSSPQHEYREVLYKVNK
ncbi:hypothetical protein BPP43_12170 [Brachyspira pilosicoli P43/6/78]|uniref:Uncharacterized protein n=1 Tax=Brachyspira pilosicoli P43/6/78 TaxID=1042417 RepID=A0A3B6VV10_BRAPL|nr:hypothetical protein [Brachyspira pilosicoli]AGA67572.1 hypothetical protein BPP43_12170 [Brachyspira pilosicoli P43/6/78]